MATKKILTGKYENDFPIHEKPEFIDDVVNNKGYPIAALDNDKKHRIEEHNELSISRTFDVNSEAEMLTLESQIGDICRRFDLSETFILSDIDPTMIDNWKKVLIPPPIITSVFTRTGDIIQEFGDYSANLISWSGYGNIPSGSTNSALIYLEENKSNINHKHDKSDIIDFAHTHVKSEITDFFHTHIKDEITDFAHTHIKDEITDFAHTHIKNEITDFAHTHIKDEITDFAHTHIKDEITDFAHTHVKSEITDFAHTHEISEIINLSDALLQLNNKDFEIESMLKYVSTNLFVDVFNTKAYVENGTITYPYKTLQGAFLKLNQITPEVNKSIKINLSSGILDPGIINTSILSHNLYMSGTNNTTLNYNFEIPEGFILIIENCEINGYINCLGKLIAKNCTFKNIIQSGINADILLDNCTSNTDSFISSSASNIRIINSQLYSEIGKVIDGIAGTYEIINSSLINSSDVHAPLVLSGSFKLITNSSKYLNIGTHDKSININSSSSEKSVLHSITFNKNISLGDSFIYVANVYNTENGEIIGNNIIYEDSAYITHSGLPNINNLKDAVNFINNTKSNIDHTHLPSEINAIPLSEKGAPLGIPTLNSDGLIEEQFIPPLATTEVFDVNSEAEMLSLVAQKGDVAIRHDIYKVYILGSNNPSVLESWKEHFNPPDLIQSVFGRVGNITPSFGDYNAAQVQVDEVLELGNNVHTAIDILKNNKANISHQHVKSEISDFTHTHEKEEIINFQHTHLRTDITNFNHTHVYSEISDFDGHTHFKNHITDFAHTHLQSEITDFAHTHEKIDIVDFEHTHVKSEITDFDHTHSKLEIVDFDHTHYRSQITDFDHLHVKSEITDFDHTHLKSEITDFNHTHVKSEITDFAHTHTLTELVEFENHTHIKSQITDFDHTHIKSEITDFAHTHTLTELVEFENHTHIKSQITDFDHTHALTDLVEFENHTHSKSQITDFTHTHIKSEITDFDHTHVKSEITDFTHTHIKNEITDFAHTHIKDEITDFAHTHIPSEVGCIATIEKGAVLGVAPLDASQKIPSQYIPSAILSDIHVVNTTDEMILLTAKKGDICKVTSTIENYILSNDDPSILTNWILLETPDDIVQSFNSRTGHIVPSINDYNSSLIQYNIEFPTVENALDSLFQNKSQIGHTHIKSEITDFTHTHALTDLVEFENHTHVKSEITDFDHTHALTDLIEFENHTHIKSQITDFAHTHIKDEITDFTHTHALTDLIEFENHTHIKSQITDFAHTHTKSEITDFAHTHPTTEITLFDNVNFPTYENIQEVIDYLELNKSQITHTHDNDSVIGGPYAALNGSVTEQFATNKSIIEDRYIKKLSVPVNGNIRAIDGLGIYNSLNQLDNIICSYGMFEGIVITDLADNVNNSHALVKVTPSGEFIREVIQYATLSHTHTKSNILDFAHTHTKSEITDFAHTHVSSEISGVATLVDSKIPIEQIPTELISPVTSIFNRTGVVTSQSGDYSAQQINFSSINFTSTHVLDALNELFTKKAEFLGGTTAERSSTPKLYERFYDTTISKEIIWNGTNWVDSMGTIV